MTIAGNGGVTVGSTTNEGSGTLDAATGIYVGGVPIAGGGGTILGSSTTASPQISGHPTSGLYATSTTAIGAEIAGNPIIAISASGLGVEGGLFFDSVGSMYMEGTGDVFVGTPPTLVSQEFDTSLGLGSLSNATANNNTASGYNAGYVITGSQYNTAFGSGALSGNGGAYSNLSTFSPGANTAIGGNSLYLTGTGAQNNTALGYGSGSSITTGSSNVIIGPSVGSTTLTTGSNNILIGTTSAVDATTSGQTNYINIGGTYQGYDTTHTALLGGGSLATTATGGFVEIPTTSGLPTGTPVSHSGFTPLVYDTATNTIYAYNSTWQNTSPLPPVEQYQLSAVTSGTSWVSPAGITTSTNFKITLVGGGGGSSSGNPAGSSGAACVWFGNGLSATTTYTVAIGTAGTGGSSNGGNTTFNNGSTTITAGGGLSNSTTVASCTNSTYALQTGGGQVLASSSGSGGSNSFGGGGSAGNNGQGWGGGGGQQTGGSPTTGAPGGILIEWVQ